MPNIITDFYPGTTKKFTITCSINGVTQDITGDTITFRMKSNQADKDANAVLTKAADVATQGASGIAIFDILPGDTVSINTLKYWCDIAWELAGGAEYVIYSNEIELLQRVSDT